MGRLGKLRKRLPYVAVSLMMTWGSWISLVSLLWMDALWRKGTLSDWSLGLCLVGFVGGIISFFTGVGWFVLLDDP